MKTTAKTETPEQRTARYIRKRVVSNKMLRSLIGYHTGEVYLTVNVDTLLNALKENTVEAWSAYSIHPGADEFAVALAIKKGYLAIRGNKVMVTPNTVQLLSNPSIKSSLS